MKLLVKIKIMTQDFYHMSTAECAVQVSDSCVGSKREDGQAKGGVGVPEKANRQPAPPGGSAVTWPPGQGFLTWIPRILNETPTAMGPSWPSSGLDSLFQCRRRGFDPWLGS